MSLERGQQLTLAEIMSADLPDSPFLMVDHNPVQTAHMTDEEFLGAPGWSESEWKYLCTTNECIPLFTAVDPDSVKGLVDIEVDVYDSDALWVVPKAYPLAQYTPSPNWKSTGE